MTLNKIKHSLLLAAMVAFTWSCGSSGNVVKISKISAPTGVTATAVNSTTMKVTWTAVSTATGYIVYYSTSAGVTRNSTTKHEMTSSVTTGEVSVEITGLSAGTYYVAVASKDANGESASISTPEATATLTESTSGVALHTGATWTKSERGPVSVVWVDQETTGDNGEVIGSRSINKGRLTYKITGINLDYTETHRWSMWLLSDVGGSGTNFQFMAVTNDHTRLIMQRFNDFSACSPRGLAGGRWGCEEQDIHGDLAFDPSQTYNWDCTWDGTADSKLVTCNVTTADGSFSTVYQVGMGGEYGPLTEMGIGTFSIDGYPMVDSIVTDFRFSVL